jgi:hypothetical protein
MVQAGSSIPASPGSEGSGRIRSVLSQSAAVGSYDWFRQRGRVCLLYVGISPSAPPTNGKAASKRSLSHRLRYHMRGNAEGSTLRLTLGCLLADQLGIELRRVGTGTRLTFSTGEERLSQWMDENARVVWKVCKEPWKLEKQLIVAVNLPLNLDLNNAHTFFPALFALRRAARVNARALPILPR